MCMTDRGWFPTVPNLLRMPSLDHHRIDLVHSEVCSELCWALTSPTQTESLHTKIYRGYKEDMAGNNCFSLTEKINTCPHIRVLKVSIARQVRNRIFRRVPKLILATEDKQTPERFHNARWSCSPLWTFSTTLRRVGTQASVKHTAPGLNLYTKGQFTFHKQNFPKANQLAQYHRIESSNQSFPFQLIRVNFPLSWQIETSANYSVWTTSQC